MKERNKIGEMFIDRNGKTSGKRVMGAIGCIVGYALAFLNYETTLVLGVLTIAKALLASSLAEKYGNTKGISDNHS
jgi:hypothetical protein